MVFILTSHSRWMDERVGHLLQLLLQRFSIYSRNAGSNCSHAKSLLTPHLPAAGLKNYLFFKNKTAIAQLNTRIIVPTPAPINSYLIPARRRLAVESIWRTPLFLR